MAPFPRIPEIMLSWVSSGTEQRTKVSVVTVSSPRTKLAQRRTPSEFRRVTPARSKVTLPARVSAERLHRSSTSPSKRTIVSSPRCLVSYFRDELLILLSDQGTQKISSSTGIPGCFRFLVARMSPIFIRAASILAMYMLR